MKSPSTRLFPHPARRARAGFALVSSLTLMVLLAILALAMLGLSSIELRKAGDGADAARARANARLALTLALGQLQQHLGPDQRVCADARIAHGPQSDPAHPHWLGVWSTTRPDGSPWIQRRRDEGGLVDTRGENNNSRLNRRLALLVSGNENGILHRDDSPGDPQDMATLVGEGSLGSQAPATRQVRAPRVALDASGRKGAYAWWIGDLGAQANLASRDATEAMTHRETRSRQLSQDASWSAVGGRELENSERARLASQASLALVGEKPGQRAFHDLTVHSAALPIDAREGGWRRDLSAYLESNGSIPPLREGSLELPGLADSDNLVGPPNAAADSASPFPGQASRLSVVSPKFGLLRTWARRANEISGKPRSLPMETANLVNQSTGGRNTRSVDFRNRTTTHLMPVLAEGAMYYHLSYYEPSRPQPGNPFALRVHFLPRVALWNPYNIPLAVPDSAIFLHINGSKSVEITMENGQKQNYRMYWGLGGSATGGSVRGSMFFKLAAATIPPGATLVWSAARAAAYDETNFGNNLLSADVAPSPQRAFHQDQRADGFPLFQVLQGFPPRPGLANNLLPRPAIAFREVVPPRPAGNIQSAAWTQADDYFMSWKPLTGSAFTLSTFATMPMGRFISCAYQYGDEDEMPVEWTALDPVPMPRTHPSLPVLGQTPDRRTRDGFRLRWFQETESNILGSGSLAGMPHLEDAALGNWNMRASWSFRNPFDNVTDVAPHFFGIYTRDLFDGEVDWTRVNPRLEAGQFRGDPFDQPLRARAPRVLFDIPRRGAEIISLGALQHVNFSEFIWHPTYALGNSLADPRVPADRTEPDRRESIFRDKGGWNQDSIGYSTDGRSNTNGETNRTHIDNWAWHARNFLQQIALDQNLIYDLSYELNHSLWDSYFLSSGSAAEKRAFLRDPQASPLPNGRLRLQTANGPIRESDLLDFHRAAPNLVIDGAFHVNSTSVAAWEALLLSASGGKHGADHAAFPRILETSGETWDGNDPREDAAWNGQRILSRAEIRRLAEAIVHEVRTRGPFLGLADFVNRRLTTEETSRAGTLQAAIDRAGINQAIRAAWPLDNSTPLPDYRHNDNIADPTRLEQTRKPDTTAWGAPGFLTQADLLQFLGPALSGRSDSFRIRAYGEARDSQGRVTARAWCEAIVQRGPDYIHPDDSLLTPPTALQPVNTRFGRKFHLHSFRWLRPEEV